MKIRDMEKRFGEAAIQVLACFPDHDITWYPRHYLTVVDRLSFVKPEVLQIQLEGRNAFADPSLKHGLSIENKRGLLNAELLINDELHGARFELSFTPFNFVLPCVRY